MGLWESRNPFLNRSWIIYRVRFRFPPDKQFILNHCSRRPSHFLKPQRSRERERGIGWWSSSVLRHKRPGEVTTCVWFYYFCFLWNFDVDKQLQGCDACLVKRVPRILHLWKKIRRRKGRSAAESIMCIAAWVWQFHPHYPLILLLNRDEYHNRPTKPVEWWEWGSQMILGGRDVKAGGTWMGCTRNGRLAFLTNVREIDKNPSAKTRGDLPVKFLESEKSPLEFAEEISTEAKEYNGFNLILADLCLKSMVYVSNRPKGDVMCVQAVQPGIHVLTNAQLDTPWPKAQCLGEKFKELLDKLDKDELPVKDMLEQLMCDRKKADREMLPNTGYDLEWEFQLSSIFVEIDTELGKYGTRSQAALSMNSNGQVILYERYLEENKWKEHAVEYQIENKQ